MNYIIHLNAFFMKAEEDHWLTPYHQSLYLALFRAWNQARFKQVLKIYREPLMAKAKIGSKATYYRCMKELSDAGYIQYYPSKLRYEAATVTIVPFNTTIDVNSGSQMVSSESGSETTQVSQMVRFPKQQHKYLLNKTINDTTTHQKSNDENHIESDQGYQEPF
ncbi:hypothetical protein SAMN05428949_4717 [Chitinophaga sp. YR627]|uniref:hypothetical protein n=1 Tax=Chitinophaga sp. YR627 TaxID=1881041 RepID=UPI0008E17238|nr:hypothetical protein [Chitinophaga sp. YR627]SFO26663.1 hypothetical protein SAMN05428949_4717 [Chitinophaga sp. YR627]